VSIVPDEIAPRDQRVVDLPDAMLVLKAHHVKMSNFSAAMMETLGSCSIAITSTGFYMRAQSNKSAHEFPGLNLPFESANYQAVEIRKGKKKEPNHRLVVKFDAEKIDYLREHVVGRFKYIVHVDNADAILEHIPKRKEVVT